MTSQEAYGIVIVVEIRLLIADELYFLFPVPRGNVTTLLPTTGNTCMPAARHYTLTEL